MEIQSMRGALSVLVGAHFGPPDVARVQEAIAALGPWSRLTVDFSAVEQSDDSALAQLAESLSSLSDREVALLGLTLHQQRLLKYLGFAEDFGAAATGGA